MAKEHDDRPRESHREEERHEHRRDEPYDNPAVHREIEHQRFHGGLKPTPELYALAQEQWYQLPGSIVRPSMNPGVRPPDTDQQNLPEKK